MKLILNHNNMKKQLILLFTLLSICTSVWAQKEYRLAKTTGRLNLNINGAIVEGYDGNEIIFSAKIAEEEVVDERAKGLKAISGSGFSDNTGLGIDVTVNGQDINVNTVSRRLKGILTIKVPQNIKVSFTNNTTISSDEVFLKNLKNEIEVSTTYNKIKLENNTGPMNIKTMYGSVDASFTGEIKGPVSIISVYSFVDVSLPAGTKANVELSTSYGKLYAADEFKIVMDKTAVKEERSATTSSTTSSVFSGSGSVNGIALAGVRTGSAEGNSVFISGNGAETFRAIGFNRDSESIKGKINGGGVDLIFKSNYKNVYLRQK